MVYVEALLFTVSLAVLLKASDLFTSAAVRVGLSLGASPFMVGATVVAGGTSLPELANALLASVRGAPGIVVGNVVGSNIANLFLVIGVAAAIGGGIIVERELMRVDLPILAGSAAFLLVAVWDTPLVWYEGLLGLIGLAVYVHFTLSRPARLDETVQVLVEDAVGADTPASLEESTLELGDARAGPRTYLLLLGSLVLVFGSADVLVRSILAIADDVGVGTDVLALTAVSIGTVLPEIAVSVSAVRGGDPEIAVGNVLGSNVFNTFAVLGVASFVAPLSVPGTVRSFALPVMVLATTLYFFIAQDREITSWEGAMMLLLYGVFVVNLFGRV
jgi:cation:H+ antiporter